MTSADPWDGVPRLALPVLWVAAASWLALSYAVRGLRELLVLAERAHAALGRAVTSAYRVLVQVLGPLGRLLRRGVDPVLDLLHRARAAAGRALLRHVLVPLGRGVVTAWTRGRPLRRLLAVAVVRVIRQAGPVLRVLGIMMTVLHAVVLAVLRPLGALCRRLGVLWRRASAPVVRTARLLRLLLADRLGPRQV